MLSKYLTASTEAISHQANDKFGDELAEAVRSFRDGGTQKDLKKELSAIIKKRTNINTRFTLTDGMNAYVLVPTIKSDHVLYSDDTMWMTKSMAKKVQKRLAGKKGKVDTKKVWVDGVFADKDWSFKICIQGLHKDPNVATPEEVAAVILHELGHAFTYMEFITDVVVRNITLAAVVDELFKKEYKDQRVELISDMVKAQGYKDINPAELAQASDAGVAYAVIARAEHREPPRSSNGSTAYDKAGWEAAADQFATRFGYGVHLSTFLGKLFRLGQKLTITFKLINIAATAALATIMPGLALALTVADIALSVIVGLLVDPTKMIYDQDGDRLRRVRQETTGFLKTDKMEKEDAERILNDIDKIEEIAKSHPQGFQLHDFVWRNISNNYSRSYKQKVFQKDLEELANSKVFAAAAVLKTI